MRDDITFARPTAMTLAFSPGDKVVIQITPDGQLIAGEGLSGDEATRAMFDVMAKIWPHLIAEWAKANGYVKG
jgi:hypothetical protein